jgi:hypothetical protein
MASELSFIFSCCHFRCKKVIRREHLLFDEIRHLITIGRIARHPYKNLRAAKIEKPRSKASQAQKTQPVPATAGGLCSLLFSPVIELLLSR